MRQLNLHSQLRKQMVLELSRQVWTQSSYPMAAAVHNGTIVIIDREVFRGVESFDEAA
jgi:hypothetical protein